MKMKKLILSLVVAALFAATAARAAHQLAVQIAFEHTPSKATIAALQAATDPSADVAGWFAAGNLRFGLVITRNAPMEDIGIERVPLETQKLIPALGYAGSEKRSFRRGAQHVEGAVASGQQLWVLFQREARFEHSCVRSRFPPGKRQIRPPALFQRPHGGGATRFPRGAQFGRELGETLQRHFSHERIAVAEMPVRRSAGYAHQARHFGEAEPGGPVFPDQLQRGLHHGFPQVAMMVAIAPALGVAKAHVNRAYIT